MSTPSWKKWVTQTLKCLDQTDRISILGIGSELRGDDAVGLEIARQLKRETLKPTCLVIEAGASPENFTSVLKQFQPALVLFIDAAQMDEPPGTVRWLLPAEIAVLPATTHALPLHLLVQYLKKEIACQVALIGIQPLQTDFQASITHGVKLAADEVVQSLAKILIS